jgi:hypothetical protein
MTNLDFLESNSIAIDHVPIGYVFKYFMAPNTPMVIMQHSGFDTLFQILFFGCLTLKLLLLYLWSIILCI